jgi:hypothetical protein
MQHQAEGDDEATDQQNRDDHRALLQTAITSNPSRAPSREPHLDRVVRGR